MSRIWRVFSQRVGDTRFGLLPDENKLTARRKGLAIGAQAGRVSAAGKEKGEFDKKLDRTPFKGI